MDTEQIINVVSTVGFPIVCCYFMWKYINTTLTDFTKMLNANNESMARLCEKIDLIIIKLVGGDDNDEA